jgi:hypothetical protein
MFVYISSVLLNFDSSPMHTHSTCLAVSVSLTFILIYKMSWFHSRHNLLTLSRFLYLLSTFLLSSCACISMGIPCCAIWHLSSPVLYAPHKIEKK